MGLDTELNGANEANSEQASEAVRPAQLDPPATRKVSVLLSEQIFQRLEAATDRPGVGKSMVVEAALERFLDPAPPIEGLIQEALARITSQLERLDSDVRIVAETVALHARYHLTLTPPMAQPQQREACALGEARFRALAEQVDKRARLGRPLMREAIDRLSASKADASRIDDASLVSANSDQEVPAADIPEGTVELTAAVEEDGSRRNFRHLPNAFC